MIVVLIWAGNFTVSKLAFQEIAPLAFTAIRFVIGSVVLWAVLRRLEPPAPLPPGALRPLIWLGLIGNTVYQLCFVEGLARTSATQSALILAAMPVMVTLFAWLLGVERVSLTQRLAVLGAFAGVLVVLLARGGTLSGFGLGSLLLLGAVVSWTIYTLLLKRWTVPVSSLRLTAWTLYTGTPGLVLAGMPELLRTDWGRVSWAGWSGILYAAVLSLGLSYVLWNRGVTLLGPTRASVYSCVVPLLATVIAMVGLGERPGLVHLVGGGLIIAGVLMSRRGG